MGMQGGGFFGSGGEEVNTFSIQTTKNQNSAAQDGSTAIGASGRLASHSFESGRGDINYTVTDGGLADQAFSLAGKSLKTLETGTMALLSKQTVDSGEKLQTVGLALAAMAVVGAGLYWRYGK